MFGVPRRVLAVLGVVLVCAIAWVVFRVTTPDDSYYQEPRNLPRFGPGQDPTPSSGPTVPIPSGRGALTPGGG